MFDLVKEVWVSMASEASYFLPPAATAIAVRLAKQPQNARDRHNPATGAGADRWDVFPASAQNVQISSPGVLPGFGVLRVSGVGCLLEGWHHMLPHLKMLPRWRRRQHGLGGSGDVAKRLMSNELLSNRFSKPLQQALHDRNLSGPELVRMFLTQSADDGDRRQQRLRSKPSLDRGDVWAELGRHSNPGFITSLGSSVRRTQIAVLDPHTERLGESECISC
jgi:hypothetical protein